jgi:hypothetical protein
MLIIFARKLDVSLTSDWVECCFNKKLKPDENKLGQCVEKIYIDQKKGIPKKINNY